MFINMKPVIFLFCKAGFGSEFLVTGWKLGDLPNRSYSNNDTASHNIPLSALRLYQHASVLPVIEIEIDSGNFH